MRLALLLVIAVSLVALSGCPRDSTYHCDDGSPCPSGDRCEANHLCSVPVSTVDCASGHRYDGSAGDHAGDCVGGDEPSSPDAMADGPPPVGPLLPAVRTVCAEGLPFTDDPSACVRDVCAQDADCCSVNWDHRCVELVERLCDQRCSEVAIFGGDGGLVAWDPELGSAGKVFSNNDPDNDKSTSSTSFFAATADLDNDGDADVAVADKEGWVVLRNDSTTTLELTVIATGRIPTSDELLHFYGLHIGFADWDNDHDLDFAVSGYNGLMLVRNDNGTFKNVDPLLISTRTFDFDWGDINGDHKVDLVVGNWGDGRIFLNHGDRLVEKPWGGAADETSRLCDLVGDDRPEVITTTDRELHFYGNRAGAISETGATVAVGPAGSRWSQARCGDFDGDGDQDVTVSSWDDPNSLYVFRNKGIKQGLESKPVFTLTDGQQITGLDFGDLDGDHKLDIVTSDRSRFGMWWLQNTTGASGDITFRGVGPLAGFGGQGVDLGPTLTRP